MSAARIPAAILREFQERDREAFEAEVQAYLELPRRDIPEALILYPTEETNARV